MRSESGSCIFNCALQGGRDLQSMATFKEADPGGCSISPGLEAKAATCLCFSSERLVFCMCFLLVNRLDYFPVRERGGRMLVLSFPVFLKY